MILWGQICLMCSWSCVVTPFSFFGFALLWGDTAGIARVMAICPSQCFAQDSCCCHWGQKSGHSQGLELKSSIYIHKVSTGPELYNQTRGSGIKYRDKRSTRVRVESGKLDLRHVSRRGLMWRWFFKSAYVIWPHLEARSKGLEICKY